jgi:hypothetical protein
MQTIAVSQRGNGLGDSILGLPVALGMKARYPAERIIYLCNGATIPFLNCFSHNLDCVAAQGAVLRWRIDKTFEINRTYPIECKERSKLSRIDYYCAEAENVEPVLPVPRQDLPDSRWGKCVVLAIGTEWKSRQWSIPHFLHLENLLRDSGERVVILHKEHKLAEKFKSERLINGSAEQVCSLILGAKLVIGLDSGPAHLAGALGTPTIALCGPTSGQKVFSVWKNVHTIQGKLQCDGCYWTDCPTLDCNTWCASLNLIHPEEVMEACCGIVGSSADFAYRPLCRFCLAMEK